MKKIFCIVLAVILCLSIYFVGGMFYFRWKQTKSMHESTQNMLKMAQVPDILRPELIDYVYWKDPLSYVDGYEVMAARAELDSVPESWVLESIRLEELEAIPDFYVDLSAFSKLDVELPARFDAYYFSEIGSHNEFKAWEFYIGLYSEDGLLLVYRGHDLNFELMDRLAEEPSSDESYWEYISKE